MGRERGQCMRTGCWAQAEWHPVLLLRAFKGHPPTRAIVGVKVCGFCKTKLQLSDVLTDALWQSITESIRTAGRLAPIFELTTLDFCGINSKEAKALAKSLAERSPS